MGISVGPAQPVDGPDVAGRVQLAAEQRGPHWGHAAHLLLIPDLLAYWLTGELGTFDERKGNFEAGIAESRVNLAKPQQTAGNVSGEDPASRRVEVTVQ